MTRANSPVWNSVMFGLPEAKCCWSSFGVAKWEPLSDRMIRGQPNRPKWLNKLFAAEWAVASSQQKSSVHRVKVSIITSTYPLSGNGPMKSIFRHSIAVYVEVVNGAVWIGTLICDIFWQHGHSLMSSLTSCRIYCHLWLAPISLATVLSTPPCSTMLLWQVCRASRLVCERDGSSSIPDTISESEVRVIFFTGISWKRYNRLDTSRRRCR